MISLFYVTPLVLTHLPVNNIETVGDNGNSQVTDVVSMSSFGGFCKLSSFKSYFRTLQSNFYSFRMLSRYFVTTVTKLSLVIFFGIVFQFNHEHGG